jgi:hypothetical protein
MKPVHLLGLTVFLAACAAAVIEYTVRAMFTGLDGMYSHDFDW